MSNTRSERLSLQILSEFDVRENAALGTADYNTESGSFANVSGTPAKIKYYCRSIFNPSGTADVTVAFNMFDDTTTYTAYIPAGQWFHSYGNIKTILDAGTDEATVTLAYVNRGKVDATGNF